MFIERNKYRKLRSRVSSLPYYWQLYQKKYPKNADQIFIQLKINYFFLESNLIKENIKLPFLNRLYIKKANYNKLSQYANASKKLRSSLKRNKAIKTTINK